MKLVELASTLAPAGDLLATLGASAEALGRPGMTGRVVLVVDMVTGAMRDGGAAARSEPGRTGLPRPVGVVPDTTGLPFVAGGTAAVGKTVGGFGVTTGAGGR